MDLQEKLFEQQLSKKWYPQGIACTPALIGPCATSGFDLEPIIGSTFKGFLLEYGYDSGTMYYQVDELNELSRLLLEKIKKDKKFLEKTRKKYEGEFNKAISFFDESNKWLSVKTVGELIELAAKGAFGLRKSVGIGHVIEPFALTTDVMIRERLGRYLPNQKELNAVFSLLCSPSEKSFINRREDDLFKISREKSAAKREKLISRHLKEFFWIKNAYIGKGSYTKKDVEEELKAIHSHKSIDLAQIKKKREEKIKELGLDSELVSLLEASDFFTNWQDERKVNILVAIDRMEQILSELGKRLGVDVSLLRFVSCHEMNEAFLLQNGLKKVLQPRIQGCMALLLPDKELFLTGVQASEFKQKLNAVQHAHASEVKMEIRGMTASVGTAIGRVKVCFNLDEIMKVGVGDILVAPMTRPEYLPAMKKAAAFVTDEGGITSHAAIVSREMGKPCIIGTKVATKVLKDGDLVEVKANHGVVRIIERK